MKKPAISVDTKKKNQLEILKITEQDINVSPI